jgi:hypothetical protein
MEIWFQVIDGEPSFMIQEPNPEDAQYAEILGRNLSVEESLQHSDIQKIWSLLDELLVSDPLLSQYLKLRQNN